MVERSNFDQPRRTPDTVMAGSYRGRQWLCICTVLNAPTSWPTASAPSYPIP